MLKLFHGKDTFLSHQEARSTINQLQNKFADYSLVQLDCSSTEPEKIVQAYESFDMFSTGKIIYLKRVTENSDFKAISENIIEFCKTSDEIKNEKLHMLLWEFSKLRSNTRLYKLFKKTGQIYESPKLNKRTFLSWAKKYLKSEDIKLESSAISELAYRADFDTQRFSNEVEKLSLSGKKTINKSDLANLTSDTFEIDIWKLIDGLNKSDKKASARSIEKLFKQNIDPFFIYAMIARNIRQITQVKSLLSDSLSNSEICSALKIPPFTLPAIKLKAESFDWDRLTMIYEKTNNLDYEMKTGRIDPKLGLTLLITVL